MATARAQFALDIDSNAQETANSSAAALEKLKTQLQGDVKELREMRKAMRNLKTAGAEGSDAAKQLQERIEKQQSVVAKNQAAFVSLGGSFRQTGQGAQRTSRGFKELASSASAAPGVVGLLGQRLQSLSQLFGGGALAGAVLGVAAALGVLTTATVAAAAALSRYAVKQADARRSERLRLEGLTKVRRFMLGGGLAFGEVGGDAQFLQNQIDRVSSSVAIGRDQVASFTRSLKLAGLQGGNLQEALEAVSIVAATQGQREAERFKALAVQAQFTGQSVKALADDVRARLGGIAEKQLLSLEAQSRKLRESFQVMFRDIPLEGLLKAVKGIVDLFKQGTVEGKAMKQIFEGIVRPFIAAVEAAAPIVKRFFQGMIIAAQEVIITILRLRRWFQRTFSGDLVEDIDLVTAAVTAGKIAVFSLVSAVALLAITAGVLAFPFIAAGVGITLMVRELEKLLDLWQPGDFKLLVDTAIADFGKLVGALTDIGRQAVEGIAKGIREAFSSVKNAIMSLSGSTIQWFKNALGIASPSRVFVKAALEVPRGIEVGFDRGRSSVRRAVEDLTAAPRRAAGSIEASAEGGIRLGAGIGSPDEPAGLTLPRGSLAGAGGQRSAPAVQIDTLSVEAPAGQDPEDFGRAIVDELNRRLEGVAISIGARTAGAEAG